MRVKEKSEKAGIELSIQKTKIVSCCPITSRQTDGEKVEAVIGFIFLGFKITVDGNCSHKIKRRLLLGRKAMTKPRQYIKKQRYHLANKGPHSQSCGFSSSHVWIWELEHKEGWVPKNWCFWTVVLEKILESPLDSEEIKPVNHKGNKHWIFIGRTDTEPPILWPPDAKSQTHWKRPWCWERLQAEGEQQRIDGWMASPTQWTWVWTNSRR